MAFRNRFQILDPLDEVLSMLACRCELSEAERGVDADNGLEELPLLVVEESPLTSMRLYVPETRDWIVRHDERTAVDSDRNDVDLESGRNSESGPGMGSRV